MPDSTWRLDGRFIRATVYPKGSSQSRESSLDLDWCCGLTSDWTHTRALRAIEAPEDLSKPDGGHILPHKLSEDWVDTALTFTGNGNIHCRNVLHHGWPAGDQVFDSDLNMNDYLRFSDDGRIEFVHPPPTHLIPPWLSETAKFLNDLMKNIDSTPLEIIIDKAMDQFQDWLLSRGHLEPDVKEWMKGTYVDNGKLIRRGN